jgi:hypothetical protein
LGWLDKAVSVLRDLRRSGSGPPETLVPAEYVDLLLRLTSRAIGVPGDILEVGVYKGGTLYRVAAHVEESHRGAFEGRSVIGIDTFEGHPYIDPDKDPPQHFKGRFGDTSYESVRRKLERFPFVRVLKGECGEVFSRLPRDQRFCMVNVDVDIYESYVKSIEYAYPRLSPGGIMICDEYQGYGQKEFIDAYFKDKPVVRELRTGLPGGGDYGLIIRRNPA